MISLKKQFHVLKLGFDMLIRDFMYNLWFYNPENYKKLNVQYNNSLKVS